MVKQVALGLMHSVSMPVTPDMGAVWHLRSVKGQLYSWGKGPATGFDATDVIGTPRQVSRGDRSIELQA